MKCVHDYIRFLVLLQQITTNLMLKKHPNLLSCNSESQRSDTGLTRLKPSSWQDHMYSLLKATEGNLFPYLFQLLDAAFIP